MAEATVKLIQDQLTLKFGNLQTASKSTKFDLFILYY